MLGVNTAPGQSAVGEFGVAAVPGREQEFAAVFKQALDYITAIGGCQIHCLAGRVPPEQRPAAEATFVRNLTWAADAAREKNVTVLIEPINPRDRPDYFLTRAEHAADIIAKVERPNVRIQFDFYHAQIVGGDLVKRLGPIVGGGGGGRPDFAEAGGKKPEQIDALLAATPDAVQDALASSVA